MAEEEKLNKKLVVLALVILLVATGVLIFKTVRKKTALHKQNKKVEEKIAPTKPKVYSASFSLENTSFKVGEEIALLVALDSQGEEVIGFDVIVVYDQEVLEFKSVTSLNPEFTVSFLDEKGKVVATGVKAPEVKTSYVFENDKVVAFNFLAKKEGSVKLQIVKGAGRDVSQIVNNDSQKLPLEGDVIELTILP